MEEAVGVVLVAIGVVLWAGFATVVFFGSRWALRRFSSLGGRSSSVVSGLVSASVVAVSVSNLVWFSLGERLSSLPPLEPTTLKVAVATVLPTEAEPKGGDNVWGLILLGRARSDNESVCVSFYHSFKVVQHPIDEYRFILRPTYWPDRRKRNQLPERTDCRDLVENYDWLWTGAQLNKLNLAGVKGPVLVAVGPAPKAPAKLVRTVLDLSSTPTSELYRVFADWTRTMESDPSDWHETSFIEQLRTSLRNFLIVQGDSLFAAIIEPGELVKRAHADPIQEGSQKWTNDPSLVKIDLGD